MSQPEATLVVKREPSGTGGSHSTTEFAALDPEIHQESYARLSWAAAAYATAYALAFGLWWLIQGGTGYGPRPVNVAVAVFAILVGLSVFFLSRRRLIPVGHLTKVAFGFQIFGAVGINAGMWGWQMYLAPDRAVTGIPWVCVWILVFPSVIPAAPRKTLLSALVAATSVPVIMISSLLVLGSPGDVTSEQTGRFIFSLSYPAFISAGLAYWVAILFYKLSRETSKARRLGSYQLVERIGAGGMGEVWKAKHRLLVRPAAIKIIRDDAFSSNEAARWTAIKRFEREAQATAGLCSPHTVELYDFGITGDGTFYYVMELLDGADLRRLVERFGPVPQERAIYILQQACHSLQDAHLSGIVHRDIKPANIFTCRRGHDYDFVKVLDFGLLAATENMDDARMQLTAAGTVTGTPAFMAPEIASGTRVIDPRVDLYALGCVAYWLLTGQLVFDDSSPMGVLIKHAKDPPPPPSMRTEMPIHPELERIILSCLEKDPSKRPDSADVLARQLAKCQHCVPEWTSEHAAAWWRTHLPDVVAPPRVTEVTPATAVITKALE